VNNADGSPGADTITINVTGAIILTRSIDIGDSVTINGPGANMLTVNGNNVDRVFTVATGAVVINGITIANGRCAVGSQGGGVNVSSGSLELNDCAIVGNSVPGVVGDERNGGGIKADSLTTLIARRCLFVNNIAEIGLGGAIRCTGQMLLENCTIAGNHATEAAGISYRSDGLQFADVRYCTVSGNVATLRGGGVRIGEGIFRLTGSIFAGNSAPSDPDVNEVVQSMGFNIVGIVGSSTGWTLLDKLNTNPKLASLANNGGPTQTMALLAGSPALNAGNVLSFPPTDQRGVARPIFLLPDIGAFESPLSADIAPVADAGPDQTINNPSLPVTVALDGSGSSDADGDTLTYTWFNSANNVVATTAQANVSLGIGTHVFRLVVEDPSGATDEDEVTIVVEDPAAPSITGVSASPNRLWPPTHELRMVTVNFTATDPTDKSLTLWLTVTSSEADSGLGLLDLPGDIVIVNPHSVKLRAERFSILGRNYVITIHALDKDGNETTRSVTVRVPYHGSTGGG
jgi:hypothetical protein